MSDLSVCRAYPGAWIERVVAPMRTHGLKQLKTRLLSVLVMFCGFGAISYAFGDKGYLNPIQDIKSMEKLGSEIYKYYNTLGDGDLATMRKAAGIADKMIYDSKVSTGLIKSAAKDDAITKTVNYLVDGAKSTRAWGIASAVVAKYMKVRTIVRYAYEEIQLWKGVIDKYNAVKALFKQFKERVKTFGNSFEDLFIKGKGHGFVEKLEKFVDLYDQADNLKQMPKTLNQRLVELEDSWDALSADEFTYNIGPWVTTTKFTPGMIIPKSKATFDVLTKVTLNNKYTDAVADWTNPKWREEEKKQTPVGQRTIELNIDSLGREYDTKSVDTLLPGVTDPFRYYTLPIISNEILLASALSLSNGYLQWSQRAMVGMGELDKKIQKIAESDSTGGGVNGYEFAAAWYAIENVNAKNKLLRHSVEETKILTALVGTDLHLRSTKREWALRQDLDFVRSR